MLGAYSGGVVPGYVEGGGGGHSWSPNDTPREIMVKLANHVAHQA